MFGIKPKIEVSFDEAIASGEISSRIEKPISLRSFYGIGLIGTVILAIAAFRLVDIGIVNSAAYELRAKANVNREIQIPAPRGVITDRFGKPLLENQPVFSVYLKLVDMIKHDETAKVVASLSEVLGMDRKDIVDELYNADFGFSDSVLIKQDITRKEAIDLKSLGFESIHIQDDYKRKYTSEAFSHVVGYVGLASKAEMVKNKKLTRIDFVGKSGLEAYYDEKLRGRNGKKVVYKDAVQEVRGSEDLDLPQIGSPLKTTIDADLQKYFYDRLVYNTSLRGQSAAVGLAINPKNGEILSLISLPGFNANKIEKYLSNPGQPLFNRAVSGVYSPGSTIKPLHAVAGLKEGSISPGLKVLSKGFIEVPNPYDPEKPPAKFRDWKEQGWVDLYSALAKSSNIYFYAAIGGLPKNELGILSGAADIAGLGIVKLNEYWRMFGLDSKTGVDLPGEAEGFLPNPDEKEKRTGDIWRIGDTYNVSIGQGDISVTPLELIDYIAAIANKGKIFRPHLNAEEESEVIADLSGFASQFKEVEIGMVDSVYKPYGTSNSMAGLPIKIAAKTGTAQTNNNSRTNALFVGYGPTNSKDGPEIAILVLIENAKEGSLNAIPIAQDVFEWYYYNRIVNKP